MNYLLYPGPIILQAVITGLNHKGFPNGKERIKHKLLRNHPQHAPRLPVMGNNVVSHYAGAAAGSAGEPCYDVDKRCFARTVGAEQGEEFALLYFQINASQSLQTAKALVHLCDFYCRDHREGKKGG